MISIIAAVARNGVIGNQNQLIWHIPEDLRRFKAITSGHPVIMGRKTFESLGRPLPHRENIVITRQVKYPATGCRVVGSLREACELYDPAMELFVIGGAQIYQEALPLAERLYLTRVEAEYRGDTCFPAWNSDDWQLVQEEYLPRGEKFEHPFVFVDYIRRKG